MNNLLKLLFMSYYFPPRPEVGGKRIDKMCALAIKRGWQPYVLTVKGDKPTDKSLALQFGSFDIELIEKRKPNYSSEDKTNSLFDKLARIFRYYSGITSDILPFYRKAAGLVRSRGIPVLFTTFPPHCVLLGALLVKLSLHKLIWVVDFRDPWIFKSEGNTLNLSYSINRMLLRWIIKNCSLVVAVSESHLELLKSISADDINSKCLYIPNAVDPGLYDGIDKMQFTDEGKITFGHLGDLDYDHRNPKPFLEAFKLLDEEKSDLHQEMELHFWGKVGSWDDKDIFTLIKDAGLADSVFYHGVVDHKTALGVVKGLDVLVLFALNQPLQVPAKTYEYLLSGKPILALCEEESETASVLRKFERVVIVTSADVNSIKTGLEEITKIIHKGSDEVRDLSMYDFAVVFSPLFSRLEAIQREKDLYETKH